MKHLSFCASAIAFASAVDLALDSDWFLAYYGLFVAYVNLELWDWLRENE